MTKYSDDEVLEWKDLYEIYGNLSFVSRIYEESMNKKVPINTIKRRLKELLGNKFKNWYEKYKLMGKYSWEDAKKWKELFENLHTFRAVEDYLKDNIDSNGPFENIIRKYIKKYITHILGKDYIKWFEKYHAREPYKYNKQNYLHWKELYENLGNLKAVREQLRNEINGNPPDAITIRKGLRLIIGEKYEEWKSIFVKKPFSTEEIEEWKRLYEKYGSIGKVSDFTRHDTKAIKKHLRQLLDKKFDDWYQKYYIHHSTKYKIKEITEWKLLFEELGSFPVVSSKIESILGMYVRPSIVRRRVKNYLEDKGINYDKWLEEFSLSDNIVDIGKKIHQILEYYFILNFKNIDIPVFYEITPSMESDDLFRVDNSIIYPQSVGTTLTRLPFTIKVINIDYLFSNNPTRLYPKMYKNYHNVKMLLIIVTLISKITNYYIPLDVPYKESIKVINIDEFFKTFSFNSNIENKMRDAIELAKKAPYSPNAYNKLKKIAKFANKQLKINFGRRSDQQQKFNSILEKI